MDATLLNRLGIVLNFLAGFMLAPELLGVERLKRSENGIENILKSMEKYSRRMLEKLNSKSNIILAILVSYIFFWAFLSMILQTRDIIGSILVTCIIFLLFIIYLIIQAVIGEESKDLETIIRNLYSILYFVFELFISLFALVFIPLLQVINLPLNFTITKLNGENRLRSIFIWWGIIFFIFGNLLQFVATF